MICLIYRGVRYILNKNKFFENVAFIDRILDKIKSTGIDSITPREKDILDRFSNDENIDNKDILISEIKEKVEQFNGIIVMPQHGLEVIINDVHAHEHVSILDEMSIG